MNINFNDTKVAFAYKTDKELRNAKWLFETMNNPWLVQMGVRFTPFLMKTGMPIDGLIRKTIFKQFVGGESLEQTKATCNKLSNFNVQVILDYGVEGKEGEANFDKATQVFINVIEYAAQQANVPFMSIKLTGLARKKLLNTFNDAPRLRSGVHDHEAEEEEWSKVKERMYAICTVAAAKGVGVLIDAEESWIQDPIDRLCMELMQEFNKEKVIVYNTVQLYRHDRLDFLRLSLRLARENNFKLGMKLVRGAYMEKERERAAVKGYASPINPDKEATDRDFNDAVKFCIDNIADVSCILASHNEESNLYAVRLMEEKGLPLNHKHLHFSQLLGMSDHITFNLAKAGASVSKYVPFGPIRDVIPYLMRRAQENSSVKGQSGREYLLIKKELIRRKLDGEKI